MSIAFLHSILRNLILYFGPVILILSCLILSVGNIDTYKQSLIQNNFYNQIATEFNKNKPNQTQNSNIQDEFYSKIIWNNVDAKFNSPEWLKKVSETNLERSYLWLTGKSETYEPYLPLNTEKTNNQQDNKKPDWLNNLTKGSNKLLEKFQNQTKELNLPKVNLPANLEIPKSPIDSESLNSLNPVYQVNQTWVKFWTGLRGYYWQLQNLAWAAITVYGLLLLGLVLTSVFFGKGLLEEFSIITRRLGINVLVSTIFFILSVSGVFLLGAVIKSLIPSSFLIGNIAAIINWQIIWLIVGVMTPALTIGTFCTVTGLITAIIRTPKTLK